MSQTETTIIAELISRLEQASGGDRELDILIGNLFPPKKIQSDGSWFERDDFARYPKVTFSVAAALSLAERVLPGWSWRVASCCVSDDAWVEPDYNCPIHGERLKMEFPEGRIDWVDLTDVDLRPSGRPAIALCIAILRARGANG